MQKTIFDTPVLSTVLSSLSRTLMKWLGWTLIDNPEKPDRYVLIAAPHTSNWDLPYTLMVAFALNIKVFWMGKAEIFDNPAGAVMRWLGGIPVNRSHASNLVQHTAEQFRNAAKLVVAVPPEGTRQKVREWKSGFYHIAREAGVPICLGFLDFGKKRAGLGPLFYPTGNYAEDLKVIQQFYADMKGKRPNLFQS